MILLGHGHCNVACIRRTPWGTGADRQTAPGVARIPHVATISPPFDKTDRAGEGDLSGVRWSYPLRTLAGDACGTRAAAGPSEGVVIRGSSSMYGTSCVAPYSEQCSFSATAMTLYSCRVGDPRLGGKPPVPSPCSLSQGQAPQPQVVERDDEVGWL